MTCRRILRNPHRLPVVYNILWVGTGKRAAGAALVGVDRLVFSRLKPTFSPGRAGGGGGE